MHMPDKLYFIVYLLDLITPKKNNQILFCSNGGKAFYGNSKALYHKFKYNKDYIAMFSEETPSQETGYINLKSIRGLYYFIRCRYLIGTHSKKDFLYPFSKRKIFIQTWHGSPIKKMGLCQVYSEEKSTPRKVAKRRERIHRNADSVSYFLSCSEIVSSSLVRCFGLAEEQILNIGYPRNDHLVNYNKKGYLTNKFNCKKIILYAPTYRASEPAQLFPFDDFDLQEIESNLCKWDCVLLLRQHIADEKLTNVTTEHIQNFGHDVCIEINDILGEVDLLITDYSSIYFDFLLLNRPCLFIPYDLEHYRNQRGLLYNGYESIMAGDIVNTQKDFLNSIRKNLDGSVQHEHQENRLRISQLFNANQTSNTYQRLVNIMASHK